MIICIDYDSLEVTAHPDFLKVDRVTWRLGDVANLRVAVVRRGRVIDPPLGEMPIFAVKRALTDEMPIILINEWVRAETKLGVVFCADVRLDSKSLADEFGDCKMALFSGEFVLQSKDESQRSSKLLAVEITADIYKGFESPPAPALPMWREDVEAVVRGAKEVSEDKLIIAEKASDAITAAALAEEAKRLSHDAKRVAELACATSRKWAEEAVDVPVDGEGGEAVYSSRHWASKAADESTTATTQAGAAKKSAEAASGSAEAAGETKEAVDETKRLIDELHKVMPVHVEISEAEYKALVAAGEDNPNWIYEIVVEVQG